MNRDASGKPTELICEVAPTNYVGMYGTTEPGVDGTGLFFRNSNVELKNVVDGAESNDSSRRKVARTTQCHLDWSRHGCGPF